MTDHSSPRSDPDQAVFIASKKQNSRDPRLVFVVQSDESRALHFDLKLEMRGMFKSWIIPKGPSMDPRVRRLAIEEDVEAGANRSGGVSRTTTQGDRLSMVWDRGWYEPVGPGAGPNDRMTRGLRRGSIRFVLHGTKLRGGFSFARFREPDQWLLIKRRDIYARNEPDTEHNPQGL